MDTILYVAINASEEHCSFLDVERSPTVRVGVSSDKVLKDEL
jgi:hypothetical protein